MTPVRIFTARNRLAKVVTDEAGLAAADLLAAAESELDRIRPRLLEKVQSYIQRLERLHAGGADGLRGATLEMGEVALAMAEIAGTAGRPELGEVGRGLRAMSEAHLNVGLWRGDALDLHFSALALLTCEPRMPPEDVNQILRRLADMRVKIGVPE